MSDAEVFPVVRVGRVIDGDTLVVSLRVRIRGVDAPEVGRTGAQQATARLRKQWPVGSQAYLRTYAVDSYGRIVGNLATIH